MLWDLLHLEEFHQGESSKSFVLSWEDGKRKFRLKQRSNEARTFILCC